MFQILVLASVALAISATPVLLRAPYTPAPLILQPQPVRYVSSPYIIKEAPKPYSFAYEAPAIGGSSSRQESSDSNGRVTGSYTVTDADGRLRIVDYYADETGFHANVQTNEPGTANQNPADVSVQSFASPVIAPVPEPVYTIPVTRRYVAPAPVPYRTYAPASYPGSYKPYSPYYRSYAPNTAYYK